MSTRFPEDVAKQLGHYVYLYSHPSTGQVFYVGKGRGNRVFDHLDDTAESAKVEAIRQLRAQGLEPRLEILIHSLPDEETALRVEAAVIDLLGKDNLTNRVRGWGSRRYGRMSVEQIVAMYRPEKAEIVEPAILIRINRLFRYGMAAAELYDATRGIWRVGEARNRVQIALAVYDGIVQEVYQVAGWFPAGSTFTSREDIAGRKGTGRWEFVGTVAQEAIRARYLRRSVRDYFPANSQNPIRYVNVEGATDG